MDAPTEPGSGTPDGGTGARDGPPAGPPREAVQRWRLTFERDNVTPEAVGRASVDAWHATLASSGLVLAGLPGNAGRPRFAIAAPLPAAAQGRAELADIWLAERTPAWIVREALGPRLPARHRLVRIEDVWLGAPPLAGQVTGAEWTVTLETDLTDQALDAAARKVLAADSLPRARAKGGADRHFDLRALIDDVVPGVGEADDPVLRIASRMDPTLGSGRPEEIVAVLAELAGAPIAIRSMVRERLILADPRPPASGQRARTGPNHAR